MTYNLSRMQTSFVKMSLFPSSDNLLPGQSIKALALHPRFQQAGNNMVVILGAAKKVTVCAVKLVPCSQRNKDAMFEMPRIAVSKSKMDVAASNDNGLIVYLLRKDSDGIPTVAKLEYPRQQLAHLVQF